MALRGSTLLVVTLGLCSSAVAQSLVVEVAEGDALPGAGHVTSIVRALVQRSNSTPDGTWLAIVRTDDPVVGEVLLLDGYVHAHAGQTAPPLVSTSARVSGFRSISRDEWGHLYWIGDLSGTSQPPLDAQARFNGFYSGIETGQPVDVQASGATFGAGAVWLEYHDLQVQGDPLSLGGLVLGTIHDPTWPGGTRTLLGAGSLISIGSCCWFDQVALSGEASPIAGRAIERLRTHAWSVAIPPSNAFPVMWSCDLDGSTLDDGCVFSSTPPNHVLVAREGSPSPVPGRVWGPLEDASVDRATNGHWTLRAELDAGDPTSDGVILLDGAVFAREGDVIAASAPSPIHGLGSGRAIVTEDGRVFWYAAWDGPSGPVEAILIDDLPLLFTGASVLGGAKIAELDDGPLGFDASRAGDHLVARVTLDDGRDALVKVALDGVQTYCTAKTNSVGCDPRLRWTGLPSASAGAGFVLEAIHLVPQVTGLFFYGSNGPAAVPFQGGTLCVEPPLTRLAASDTGSIYWCTGLFSVDFNAWAASGIDPALTAGTTVHAQAWYRDPGFAPPDDVGLTGGIEFTLAP